MDQLIVETLPILGTCSLCLSEGAVKSMITSHINNGNSEIYSDMLVQCFTIDVTKRHLGDLKPLICDDCIYKLRDSIMFRYQVEQSLEALENTVKEQNNLQKEIKQETGNRFDDDDDDDFPFDDDDDIPIKKVIKKERESGTIRNQNSKSETKKRQVLTKKRLVKVSLKKAGIPEDVEAMLSAGLFPFKMRKDKSFTCSICREKSTKLDDIKNHISQHTKANLHIAFKKMMLSNNQRFYKYQNKLRCKICTADITGYEELKQHIEHCTRLKYKTCKWTSLPFKLEKDQLDCPVCKKTFLNFVSLNTHMNVHYPHFICQNCGKAFASKARLRGHMRTHEVGSFPCKFCEAVFDRVTKRENHVSREHKSGVRYACKRCNIPLPSFYARQKHLAEVHNEELKKYKCKACPQSYITPGHLSSHVRRDHLNERNHKCDKCDLAFYTKNSLKMHMIKHDGERIHVCSICQKSYQRKKTLREHIRIHTNDKRFICPVCGRAFTQKCTLKGHLKVHEKKVDPEDCVAPPLHSI